MRREVTLEEISDGRLYDANDMVKADCQDCKGCHDCCTGMGDSVLLDPYDVCRLSRGLRKIPEELIGSVLELGISDGNVLPHLAMRGTPGDSHRQADDQSSPGQRSGRRLPLASWRWLGCWRQVVVQSTDYPSRVVLSSFFCIAHGA